MYKEVYFDEMIVIGFFSGEWIKPTNHLGSSWLVLTWKYLLIIGIEWIN